jgi:hypothetical protein
MESEEKKDGLFIQILTRNNKQIREDRAKDLLADAQMFYKRDIDDIEMSIRKTTSLRDSLLDLSPADTVSLKLASNFDAKDFCTRDLEYGVKLRQLTIELELAKARYKQLFGEDI